MMAPTLALVVDDDLLLRINTAEALEEAGFEVLEVGDAASALRVLQAEPGIQFVCTDVHMPGELDGVDLAMRIREHHPSMKVVVVSADRRAQDRLPSVPFLLKPFVLGRLVEIAQEEVRAFQ